MEFYEIKEGVLAGLTESGPRRGGQWEADVFPAPIPLRTKAGVCFPPVALVVETGSGFVLCAKVREPGEPEAKILGDALIAAMVEHRQVPALVAVRPGLETILAPLGGMLGMRVEVSGGMETLASAWKSLTARMKAGLP
jgi:hypothetical protein